MLSYFSHSKKGKEPEKQAPLKPAEKPEEEQQQQQEEADRSPVLSPQDERFLEHVVSDEATQPANLQEPESHSKEVSDTKKDSGKGSNHWSFIPHFGSKKDKKERSKSNDHATSSAPKEEAKDEDDLSAVLDKLSLAAENNKVFSLSKESRELVRKFTVVLQDLVNGVPTAYGDLVELLDSSQSHLESTYSRLPSYLQKLIRSLPTKLTAGLGPELLAAAAEKPGASTAQMAAAQAQAPGQKKMKLRVPPLKDLVTRPGAVAGTLRAIMNVLKLRWPAFMGTSALWSLGIFVLLLVFWYCHKRGREVRLAKEKAAEDDHRFEELDDDDDDDDDGSIDADIRASVAPNQAGPSNSGPSQPEKASS